MQTKYRFKDGLVFLESDISEEAMRLSHVPADDRILHREQTDDSYCMTIRCERPIPDELQCRPGAKERVRTGCRGTFQRFRSAGL